MASAGCDRCRAGLGEKTGEVAWGDDAGGPCDRGLRLWVHDAVERQGNVPELGKLELLIGGIVLAVGVKLDANEMI